MASTKNSFWLFVRRKLRETPAHIAASGGTALLMYHFLHTVHVVQLSTWGIAIMSLAVLIVPLLADYLIFRKRTATHRALAALETAIEEANIENPLMQNSILSRLKKETETITSITRNQLNLPAYQNFEYIREVLGRVIERVMESGDHYITLSRLDFWTQEPLEHNFFETNQNAVRAGNKNIHRIVVVRDKLHHIPATMDAENEVKAFNTFRKLVEDFRAVTPPPNYFSHLKTLFYFTSEIEIKALNPYLLSALVIRAKDPRNLMLIKVDRLKNIETTNPYISVKFFQLNGFERWKGDFDIISVLSGLLDQAVKQLDEEGSNDELTLLINYLRVYRQQFTRLETIYSRTAGTFLQTFNPEVSQLVDVESLGNLLDTEALNARGAQPTPQAP